MQSYGTLESLLEYSPLEAFDYSAIHSVSDDKDKPDALEGFLHEKVRCLSDILAAIERDIRNRKSLSLAVL